MESFTLGRFMSYTLDGCPDGYLQIAEASRAPVGGMWCGTSWGPVVFYSETRTLILTVKLFKWVKFCLNFVLNSIFKFFRYKVGFHISYRTKINYLFAIIPLKRKAICISRLYKNEKLNFLCYRLARDQSGYNFDFRLLYKVLPRETAVVRFGGIKNEGKVCCNAKRLCWIKC